MTESDALEVDEPAPKDILDGILKVQQQQMKLAGLLRAAGISVFVGSGDSDEDIVVRIKAVRPCFVPTSRRARGRCSNCKKEQCFQTRTE
jgi:hypothetical protein